MICQGFFFYTFNLLVSIVHSTVSGFVDTRLQKILWLHSKARKKINFEYIYMNLLNVWVYRIICDI